MKKAVSRAAHGASVRPVGEAVEVLQVVVLSSFVVFLAFSPMRCGGTRASGLWLQVGSLNT